MHSFLVPVSSSPREQQSARQLAGESHAALTNLESILKQRNQALEQHIKRQEQEKTKEKQNFEQNLENERKNFAYKREHLLGEIDRTMMDLVRKNEAMDQLKRRLREQQRKCDEERQRADALEQENRDLRVDLVDITNKHELEMTELKTRQAQLQYNMEKTLNEQNAAFEQERAGCQRRTTASSNDEPGVKSSLEWAMPHLRGLLDAYDLEQGRTSLNSQQTHAAQDQPTMTVATIDLTQNEDVPATRCMTEQQDAFDQERTLLLAQARTQNDISRHNLAEREAVLTCPISMELFDDPIVTACCGKTFSLGGLRRALQQSSRCPFCREPRVSFYQNRDVAKLVELHRAERSVLGLPEISAPSPTSTRGEDDAAIEHRSSASAGHIHDSRSSSNYTLRSRHRDHRSERVRARSDVHRRQHLRPHAQTRAGAGSYHQIQPLRHTQSISP